MFTGCLFSDCWHCLPGNPTVRSRAPLTLGWLHQTALMLALVITTDDNYVLKFVLVTAHRKQFIWKFGVKSSLYFLSKN